MFPICPPNLEFQSQRQHAPPRTAALLVAPDGSAICRLFIGLGGQRSNGTERKALNSTISLQFITDKKKDISSDQLNIGRNCLGGHSTVPPATTSVLRQFLASSNGIVLRRIQSKLKGTPTVGEQFESARRATVRVFPASAISTDFVCCSTTWRVQLDPLLSDHYETVNGQRQRLTADCTTTDIYISDLALLSAAIGASNPLPQIFDGETASAFYEWQIKSLDYVDVFGSNWSEADKINRLKLHLGAHTRTIFEKLLPTEKDTLSNALKSIKSKLDSPHFRELAYRKLATCYQRDGESMDEFIKRLVPLVNTTTDQFPSGAREEMLCRCLIEKMRPEYQRSLQLVAPLIGKNDFKKLTSYIQKLEISVESEKGFGIHSLKIGRSECNRKEDERTEQAKHSTSVRQNYMSRETRLFCEFCNRPGHIQNECWYCPRDFPGPSNSENRQNWEQSAESHDKNDCASETQQLREMIEDLALEVREMKDCGRH